MENLHARVRLRLARSLESQGIPREFVAKSRLVIIAKDWQTLNKNAAVCRTGGMYSPSSPAPPVPSSLRCAAGLTDARERQPPSCGPSSPIQAASTNCCDSAERCGDRFHRRACPGLDLPGHLAIRHLRLGVASHGNDSGPRPVCDGSWPCYPPRKTTIGRAVPMDDPEIKQHWASFPPRPSSTGTVTARAAPGRRAAVRRRCG